MKPLFYTSTKPHKGRFKSEKFFVSYLRGRKLSSFAHPGRNSYFKKMLMLKKFFCWYLNLKKKFLHKLWNKHFLKRRVTFRTATSFCHVLERNVLILLMRVGFCFNMQDAKALVRSRQVAVNGRFISFVAYFSQVGDILEHLPWLMMNILREEKGLLYSRGLGRIRRRFVFDGRKILRFVPYRLSISRKKIRPQRRTFFVRGRKKTMFIAPRSTPSIPIVIYRLFSLKKMMKFNHHNFLQQNRNAEKLAVTMFNQFCKVSYSFTTYSFTPSTRYLMRTNSKE